MRGWNRVGSQAACGIAVATSTAWLCVGLERPSVGAGEAQAASSRTCEISPAQTREREEEKLNVKTQPPASRPAVPPIDAAARVRTERATFALG